ncbi:MAG: hypothetical protein PHE87_08230 [Victivallaceae bacterium]|nr:hypothetical protein [Victivallaceae bacterium]
MKKLSKIFSIVALTTFLGSAALNAQTMDTESADNESMIIVQEIEEPQNSNNNNFYNMGRGLTNAATCWLEVFRCMIYRNAEAPFWGFVAGAVEGTGLTAVRAFTGVTDLLFVGFEPGNIFEPRFAEFVWQSPWLPEPKLQYKTPRLRQD